MRLLCVLYVYCMRVLCVLYAYCMRIVCVFYAYCMRIVCVLYAYCMRIVCVLYAYYMRIVCVVYAYFLYILYFSSFMSGIYLFYAYCERFPNGSLAAKRWCPYEFAFHQPPWSVVKRFPSPSKSPQTTIKITTNNHQNHHKQPSN